MRANKLRELLNSDTPSVGTHVASTSPDVVEIIGRTGVIDVVQFLAEYGPYSLLELDNFGRALELYGMAGMIKVDRENRSFVAQRAIGSGIQNILFSDVYDVADVEECVASVRADTPSSGGSHGSADRRFAGYGLESGTPEYVQALEDCVVALMIEKEAAVNDLESILSVDGVDMVVFGGNDYWMSAGKPGNARNAPDETKEVMMHVYKTAMSKGIQPQAALGGISQVQELLDVGIKHFCVGNNYMMVYQWLNENVGAIRKMFPN